MKKTKLFLLIGLSVFILIAFAGCGSKTTVKLNKYVTISAQGYDSMGTADYEFDYEAFIKDLAGKIKINDKYVDPNGEEKYLYLEIGLNDTLQGALLDMCIDQSLDNRSGLSNGDTVTLQWDCNDELAENLFNVRLDHSDIAYTVKELEEVDNFDPFDYLTASVEGTSPNGTVSLNPDYDKPEMQYVQFSADKTSGLKNGDMITVTASIAGSVDDFVKRFGCILGETKKEYKCDSLAHYAESTDEITEDAMAAMTSQAEDAFKAHVAQNWSNPANLLGMTLEGNYFLTVKSGMSASPNNYLYLVYKIQRVLQDPDQTIEYYFYYCFSDISIMADGTCNVDISNYTMPTSGGWFTSSESFKVGSNGILGYDSLESLYNSCIVSKIDRYEYTPAFR